MRASARPKSFVWVTWKPPVAEESWAIVSTTSPRKLESMTSSCVAWLRDTPAAFALPSCLCDWLIAAVLESAAPDSPS